MLKKTRNLLIAAIVITVLVLGYYIFHFSGAVSQDEVVGSIAILLVLPHGITVAIALLFNILGLVMKSKGFILTSGILYLVSIIFMPIYFTEVLIQAVLCFIAYGQQKKFVPESVN